jgi:hypothetical protein
MPYVYNPKTGKNDLWQPEEKTIRTPAGTSTVTGTTPSPAQALIGGVGQFFRDFGNAATSTSGASAKSPYGGGVTTTTSTGTGITGPAQMGTPSLAAQYTGLGSFRPTDAAGQDFKQAVMTGDKETETNYLANFRKNYEESTGKSPLIGANAVVVDNEDTLGGGDTLGVGSTSTSRVKTKDLNAQTLFDAENKLYNELRKYQEATATNTSEAQRRALEQSVKKSQLEFQQMRNAMMESGFTQDRALLQGAQQRGLGGSGLEQLGRTQQRIGLGQNLNQLSQQYGDQLQSFLNAELGIEQNLSEAMSKAALDETINVTTAMAKAMDNEWVAWQRAKTIEDSAKFDEKETASIYLEYVTALANAGEDAALKEQIRTSYKGLLPETLFNQGSNIAGNKALGDVARKASVQTGAPVGADADERARFAAAMAQDEGDGRVSMLKTGSTTLYFPNDDGLILHVRSLYSGRENANRIQISVKGGKVVYTTDQGQEFTTYNQASNSLG